MRRLFLIIDGYNLMHAAGLARPNYGPGDLQSCRRRLIVQLQSLLTERTCTDAIIVFDAFAAPYGRAENDTQEGVSGISCSGLSLRVCYASSGGDADAEIEQLLQSHSAPRQVLLVSSDHRLQKAARRRRARFVDSEEFWKHLGEDGQQQKPPQKQQKTPQPQTPRPPSASDVDPDEFLEIDVEALEQDIREQERLRRRKKSV